MNALPAREDLILGPLALTLTTHIVRLFRQQAMADPATYEPALVLSLNNLSNRLAEAGRREEGLTASQEAVDIRRRLAATNPAAYQPDLATSLNNLSIHLAEAGRPEEADAIRQELEALNGSPPESEQ